MAIRDSYGINRRCNDPIAMLRYYKSVINLTDGDGSYEDGITRHEAAYLISDTIWSDIAQTNYSIKKIAELASELELPTSNQIQYKGSWDKLVELIDQAFEIEFNKPG